MTNATKKTAADAQKDDSQLRQKRMIAEHFSRLAAAPETGDKCVYTFVPGNLTELLRCFDLLPVLPEINALQSAMRGKSKAYIALAEKAGHSEDVCTYVKCDLGMMKSGNIGPTGERLPDPDLLLLSYTGCFTFMKWFEILRQEYDAPVAMLHVPYQADGKITDAMRKYVVDQLREKIIPALERLSGRKYDEERLRELLARSARAEDDLVWVLQSAKNRPSPIDAYFGGVYYIGPIFTAFRGTEDAIDYYRALRAEVEDRIARRLGPVTPEGEISDERYRIVVEGPPTRERSSLRRPTPRSAASTISASVTTHPGRWRRWPSTAWAATRTSTCRVGWRCCHSTCSTMTQTACSSIPSRAATRSAQAS